MIDSENNILDSNKLYYYNIIQGQHANVPAYQPYAYISQPSPISNSHTISSMTSVSPMNPAVSPVTVNQVGPEMTTETVTKSDNARVKRAKQRIRQQIYVGKIVSKFFFIDLELSTRILGRKWFSVLKLKTLTNLVQISFGPKFLGQNQLRVQNKTLVQTKFGSTPSSVRINFGFKTKPGFKSSFGPS